MSMLFTNNNHINLNQGLKEAIICVTNSLKIETVVQSMRNLLCGQ